jgi:hypothetical protein
MTGSYLACLHRRRLLDGTRIVAIYHLSVKAVSRKAGRSATAAAAYRAADCIEDERTGQQYDYGRKRGVLSANIVLPRGCEWQPSRSELWNAAEQAERRKDACVAREVEVALPAELSDEERRQLALQLGRWMADREGCAVDVCLHAPGRGDDRNYHAHLLRTTRQVGPTGLGPKLSTERAGRDRKADLQEIRVQWAAMCNVALTRAGKAAQVDHRSLRDQGIDREPTRHLGPAAVGFERRTDGEPSRKRLDWMQEATERLARAAQEERKTQEVDRAIIAVSTNLQATRAAKERQDQQRAAALARTIAPRLAPDIRSTIRLGGAERIHIRDDADGSHWLVVRRSDGLEVGVARGGPAERHLAERVTAVLPAAIREYERAEWERARRDGEQTTPGAAHSESHTEHSEPQEKERDQARRKAGGGKREPTDEDIAAARRALVEYVRTHGGARDPAALKCLYLDLHAEWRAAGNAAALIGRPKPHEQHHYMALRIAHERLQAELAEQAERRRRRDRQHHEARERQLDGFTTRLGGAGMLKPEYRSAEIAAAKAMGLSRVWDQAARCVRYSDADGEICSVQRRTVTLVRHDETAEHAALRLAAARFGGVLSIRGSSAFRTRTARLAAREGIEIVDEDLAEVVADERQRMNAEQEHSAGIDNDEQDLGR